MSRNKTKLAPASGQLHLLKNGAFVEVINLEGFWRLHRDECKNVVLTSIRGRAQVRVRFVVGKPRSARELETMCWFRIRRDGNRLATGDDIARLLVELDGRLERGEAIQDEARFVQQHLLVAQALGRLW